MANRQKTLTESFPDLLQHHRVYAATTIHFNGTLDSSALRYQTEFSCLKSIRRTLSHLFCQLDRAFHNTPDVISRISADDRLHALVVTEKVSTATHVHIVWYLKNRVSLDGVAEWEEDQPNSIDPHLLSRWSCEQLSLWRRKQFILSALNNSPSAMREEDVKFLNWMHHHGELPARSPRVDQLLSGCSVLSRGVSKPEKWIEYITKEAAWKRDFSDQVLFADELFSEEQRTNPTRFFTYSDRSKHVIIFNFDEPLRPRK